MPAHPNTLQHPVRQTRSSRCMMCQQKAVFCVRIQDRIPTEVVRRSSRRHVRDNKTKKWAERSVWSMVCAIELGLMQPSTIMGSTRKSEPKESKPELPRSRALRRASPAKPNKPIATESALMGHEINSWLTHDESKERIEREDHPENHLLFLDHRYSLPAVSSFPQNLNTAGARKIFNNGDNDLAENTVVYNPYNALRDWSSESNFYKCKRRIENQSSLRHLNDLSNDTDTAVEDLPERSSFENPVRTSSFLEYLRNRKKSKTIRRITEKQRSSRPKQGNSSSLQRNEQTKTTLKICSKEVLKPEILIASVAPQSTGFNNITGPDIYEFNRTIKNQTGPLSTISSCENDSSENDHRAVQELSKDNRDSDPTDGKESYTESGEEMHSVAVKKVLRKRRYYRDRFWSRANKEHRNGEKKSGKGESKKETCNISEKILREENKKISQSYNVNGRSTKSFPQENITAVDIVDPALICGDSEDGETLLVNPFTDLPGALLESNDQQNLEIIDLHPQFHVDFDMNFEHNSMMTTLDGCLDREDAARVVGKIEPIVEEQCNIKEGNETAMSHNRSNTNMKEYLSSVARPRKRTSADSLVKSKINEGETKWNNDKNIKNSVNNFSRVTRGSIKNCVSNETNGINLTVGTVVWGKCMGWWPGLIVNAEDVGMYASEGKMWVYWINEHCISHLRVKTQIQSFSAGLRTRMIETFRMKTPKDANYAACLTTIKLLNNQILQRGPLTKPYHAWVEKHLESNDNIDQFVLYPYPPNVQKRIDELKVENFARTENYQSKLNESCDQTSISRSNSIGKREVKRHVPSASGYLPLADQKPGTITWAKVMGQVWWPGMIIDFRDCGKKEPKFGCQWILWYGDFTLSEVNHECFLPFEKGVNRMKEYVLNSKRELYKKGVVDAAKDFCSKYGYQTDGWTLDDVFEWFSKLDDDNDEFSTSLRQVVLPGIPGNREAFQKYTPRIIEGLRKHNGNCTVAAIREHNIQDSKTLKSVVSGKLDLQALCLMCLENCNVKEDKWIHHPFFEGALCEECLEKYTPTIFAYGDDGKCFFCTICAGSDTVVICDEHDCPRVYCTACLKYLMAPKTYDEIMLNDPFICFLCQDSPDLLIGGLLKPRIDWRSRIAELFHGNRDSVPNQVKYYQNEKKKLRVLSLFDGISSGLVVLNKLGIQVEAYYASEIDPDAEMVSSANFGHRIIRLGDVRSITEKNIREIAPIHLLIGGSPCNDLSLVNPVRLGLHDPNGTGILVFEYQRIKNLIEKVNGETHFFWLFENVASMPSKYRLEINEHFGREPDLIDAANYSPQHRPRLYWSNFPIVSYPLSSQDLQDILTPNCNRQALVKKIQTVTTRGNSLKQGKQKMKPILMNKENDSLWITELEEIFGFPRHYTDVKNLSAIRRQKLIGKAWSIQTVVELMRPLCNFFQGLHQDEP